MTQRSVLLGMNDPTSSDPEMALHPRVSGSAGQRLWQITREVAPGLGPDEYASSLERVNVLGERQWSRERARVSASHLLPRLSGRRVVVLGKSTLDALMFCVPGSRPREQRWFEWFHLAGADAVLLPHPSGLCHLYNNPAFRRRAGDMIFAEVARFLADDLRSRIEGSITAGFSEPSPAQAAAMAGNAVSVMTER